MNVGHGIFADMDQSCNGSFDVAVDNGITFGECAFSGSLGGVIGSQMNSNTICGSPPGNNLYGLDFYTNSKKSMSITKGGNVGIGTCTPNAKVSLGEFVGDSVFLYDAPGDKYGFGIRSTELRIFNGACHVCGCIDEHTSFGKYDGTTFTEHMRLTNSGQLGIGTSTPQTSLQVNGSLSAKVAMATNAYTMQTTDFAVLANAATGAFKVILPPANTAAGMIVFIKKIDSSKNTVTVKAAGTDKIEGKSTENLPSQYKSVYLISDGSANWYILSNAT